MTFGNWTIYNDLPIPFTNIVLIADLGRFTNFGWRRKR